jgi:hypothetical protein
MTLRRLGLFLRNVLANLPVQKRIPASASRTLPCPFAGILVVFMKHPDDEMACQAHGFLAVNESRTNSFLHEIAVSVPLSKVDLPQIPCGILRQTMRGLESEEESNGGLCKVGKFIEC